MPISSDNKHFREAVKQSLTVLTNTVLTNWFLMVDLALIRTSTLFLGLHFMNIVSCLLMCLLNSVEDKPATSSKATNWTIFSSSLTLAQNNVAFLVTCYFFPQVVTLHCNTGSTQDASERIDSVIASLMNDQRSWGLCPENGEAWSPQCLLYNPLTSPLH